MDFPGKHYYERLMNLLLLEGLSPYGNQKVSRILNLFYFGILIYIVVCQIATFITYEYTTAALLNYLSYSIMLFGIFWKYYTSWANIDLVKSMYDQVVLHWNTLDSRAEVDILRERACNGWLYLKIFTLCLLPALTAIFFCPYFNKVLDFVIPLNASRPHVFPFRIQFFFISEENFYFRSLILDLCTVIAGITFTGTEGLAIMALQHASGLFEIARYRIVETFSDNSENLGTGEKNSYKLFIRGMHMHKRALTFAVFLKEKFLLPYVVLLVLGIGSLSINLYRLSQSVVLKSVDDFLTASSLCIGIFFYMFYLHYMVQHLLDESANLSIHSYNSQWYEAPLYIRKMFLFFLMKAMQEFTIDAFGFFRPSLAGFSEIAKLSLSYFMVLWSRQ